MIVRKFFVYDKKENDHKTVIGLENLKKLTGYDAPALPVTKVTVGDDEDFVIYEMLPSNW